MKQIFVNLPVKDLDLSMKFYASLWFTPNPIFTDNTQKCMVWSDNILLMLTTHEQFTTYNKKTPTDNLITLWATFTLPVESDDMLIQIVNNGLKNGWYEPYPMTDEWFMKLRTIDDPDGYRWGVISLDMKKFLDLKNQTLS